MNQEDIFARKVVGHLNRGLNSLPPHIQSRLNVSRNIALDGRPKNIVPVGRGLLAFGNFQIKSKTLIFSLLLLGSLAVFTTQQYLQTESIARDAADLDEEILSDEAPVQAYTDPVFTTVFRSGALKRNE